jgi:hypothetical protein
MTIVEILDRLVSLYSVVGTFLAALAAVPALAKLRVSRPIHPSFSYNEEAGARGVPHLIAPLGPLRETVRILACRRMIETLGERCIG